MLHSQFLCLARMRNSAWHTYMVVLATDPSVYKPAKRSQKPLASTALRKTQERAVFF